jgi:hypothetical protein
MGIYHCYTLQLYRISVGHDGMRLTSIQKVMIASGRLYTLFQLSHLLVESAFHFIQERYVYPYDLPFCCFTNIWRMLFSFSCK